MDRNVNSPRQQPVTVSVALLAEGVDRNDVAPNRLTLPVVALLAEGVDRNAYQYYHKPRQLVALLAEGVDRNDRALENRRMTSWVALLAEGVDRNT